jgi:hypothetical protein
MSLKAFHLLFVAVSTLLAAGFGVWAVMEYRGTGDVVALACGVGSLVGAVLLVVYGRWFLRKLSGESFL